MLRLSRSLIRIAAGSIVGAALLTQPLAAAQQPWDGEWRSWPADYPRFDYSAEELLERWDALHLRDRLPPPTAAYVHELSTRAGQEPPADAAAVAERLLEGWRAFHGGDFQQAYEIGLETGSPGYFLAGRAWLTYSVHLTPDQDTRIAMLQEGIRRMEGLMLDEGRKPPFWEVAGLAMLYGQYSRLISSTRAASEGIPGTVRRLVEEALAEDERQPAALGVYAGYHTEVVDRVGGVLARVTHGARREAAREYFERVLVLDPELIQARVEFAESLLRLYGSRYAEEASEQLRLAKAVTPKDAEDYLEQLRADRVMAQWAGELPDR